MDFNKVLEHHLLDHIVWPGFSIAGIAFPITKHVIMMWIAAGGLILVLSFLARSWSFVPSRVSHNLLEAFIVFVRDEVVVSNMGEEGKAYLPYFLTLFFFILSINLLGLFPEAATASGNISVTAGLAICTFLLINFAGIRKFGLFHHFKNFIPHGLPWWLVPLMLPLELVGLVTKSFALCIRLFANMIAGHVVILAFLSLIFLYGTVFVAPPSVAAAVGINLLEVFVAFLQAYIFTLLTAIFVGASLHPH